MPTKTVIVPDDQVDSFEVYILYVKCPYCKYGNDIESRDMPPKQCKCIRCEKQFKIKIDQPK